MHPQKAAARYLEAAELVKNVSPVARQHVNVFGSFEFIDAESGIDLDALGVRFGDPHCSRSAMPDGPDDEWLVP